MSGVKQANSSVLRQASRTRLGWLPQGFLLGCMLLAAPAYARDYVPAGTCAGFPRVALVTPPGLCVGLVAEHIGFARGVVATGDTIYVLDMGGWRHGHGRLLRLRHGGHDAPEVLLSGLDEPSGLVAAPDGTLYAGLLGRIVRIDLSGTTPTLHDVLTGLPSTGRHPLPALAAAADGALYVNVGSGTDHCENQDGTKPDPAAPCRERDGAAQRAEIIHFKPAATPQTYAQAQVIATGLRNSMGLAVLPGGTLVAAVNARDAINRADPALSDAALPHDTLDVIKPGADYGWPYCFDDHRASPEYPAHDCKTTQAPTLLLPPHAAPLGLIVYHGKSLPALEGRLILPYHGYRAGGHRIMSLAVRPDGQPDGQPAPLVSGWEAGKQMPMGNPVSVAEMADGSVLITEDHNASLLRLAKE